MCLDERTTAVVHDDSETEAAKEALLHCLALGEENKQKFEEGTLEDVDSLIKRVKYSLEKLYLSTSERGCK
jgi:hypothetical protein